MIRVIEIIVFVAVVAGLFGLFDGGWDVLKSWRRDRKEEREKARRAFEDAVKARKRVKIVETLALHGPDLTKREQAVLNELRDDVFIEEEETNVKR